MALEYLFVSDQTTLADDFDNQTSKNAKRTPFPASFFVANTMEIFERLAWYGFFTVSSLYMTSPVLQGGMGFSDTQRGTLQGLIPFFLYLLPALTGSLGDRYGYRRMLMLAFAIMTPCYYLLGQVSSYGAFFVAFMGVAVGAAIFKPLISGTVSRTTDDSNRSLGFGIFYMMVNIGGFLGPLIAGYMRDISWDWVFIMAAVWIAINFIPVTFFYKDPTKIKSDVSEEKSFSQTLLEMQEVLGNGRLALTIFPIIIAYMLPGTELITFETSLIFIFSWLLINIIWNILATNTSNKWYRSKIKLGNKPFIIFLLISGGFWLVYMQIFITLPLYIRDYVDSSDLVNFIYAISPSIGDIASFVNVEQLTAAIRELGTKFDAKQVESVRLAYLELANYNVRVPLTEISQLLLNSSSSISLEQATNLAKEWAQNYRQFKPEYIIAVNFGSIVLLQVTVSIVSARFKTFYVLIAGTLLVGASYLLLAVGGMNGLVIGGAIAVLSILIFSLGEMMASPKQQEFIASVMPKEKAAMYQGYLYLSYAIGFLFAGDLSGKGYNAWGVESNSPGTFWFVCGVIAIVTALALFIFNKVASDKLEAKGA